MALPNTPMAIGRMLTGALAALALSLPAAAGTIKIGYIDPLSGPFANVGEQGLRGFTMLIEDINARGGVNGDKLELVAIDSKANPQEALNALKQLIDQDVRYVLQGNSSAVAGALSDAVAKHNSRNPDQPDAVSELRRGRPGAHQRSLQLLALPLRCGRGHEDGRRWSTTWPPRRRSRRST